MSDRYLVLIKSLAKQISQTRAGMLSNRFFIAKLWAKSEGITLEEAYEEIEADEKLRYAAHLIKLEDIDPSLAAEFGEDFEPGSES